MKRLILSLLVCLAIAPLSFGAIDMQLALTTCATGITCAGGNWVVIDANGGIVSSGGNASTTTTAGSGSGSIIWIGKIGNYNGTAGANNSTGNGTPVLPTASIDLNSVNNSVTTPAGGSLL